VCQHHISINNDPHLKLNSAWTSKDVDAGETVVANQAFGGI
jgi:hypothetical protein